MSRANVGTSRGQRAADLIPGVGSEAGALPPACPHSFTLCPHCAAARKAVGAHACGATTIKFFKALGVSRVARESVRGLLPPDGLAPWRQPLVPRCAPLRAAASARPAPCGGGRPTPQPFDGGLTPCRMRFACSLRSFGSRAPSPLRAHARADGYRGLPAFAFALPGRQRDQRILAGCALRSGSRPECRSGGRRRAGGT